MKKFKKYLALLIVATMVFSMAACGKAKTTDDIASNEQTTKETGSKPSGELSTELNTTDPITLTMSWWGGDARHEATQKAVAAFMEKYPNITVQTTFSGWTGWEETMGLAFSSGTAEDIVQINWNWIEAFSADGTTFYDLYQLKDVLDLSQFPEDALNVSEAGGKLMGVPVALTARTMFWNKGTFDKAGIDIPKTWEELLSSGETFKTVLGDEYYPMMLSEYDRALFIVYYLQSVYGKDWVVDGKVNYTEEEVGEGFAMLKQLEDAHVIPTIRMVYDYAATVIDQSDRWVDGYWAGIYTWNTSPANPKAALPDPNDFAVGPMFGGFKYKGGLNKISMEFAITSTCQHPVEAAALLQFILNEEEGVLLMGDQRGIPASEVGLDILKKNNALDPLITESTELALGWAAFPMDSQFENAKFKTEGDGLYFKVMSDHSYGNYTDQEAATALINGINEVLGN